MTNTKLATFCRVKFLEWSHHRSVIFFNENENGEKRENNEFVNEN